MPTSSAASGDAIGHDVLDRLQTERGRRVQPGAERRGVDHPEGAWRPLGMSRNNLHPPDANRARAQNPDGSRVAPHGGRDRQIVDTERGRDLFRCNTVGHQRRDPATGRCVGINRPQRDEPIERIVASVAEVHAVRHASA